MHLPSPSPAQQSDKEQNDVVKQNEEVILDAQLHGLQTPNGQSELKLWFYATKWCKAVILLSSLSGLVAGAANPFLVVSPSPDSIF